MSTDQARPAWVTDEVVARWCGGVRHDAKRDEAGAPEPQTALAPFDLSPIAAVPTCTPEDVTEAVAGARAAQAAWAGTPDKRRADLVLAFHDLLPRGGTPGRSWISRPYPA